MLRASGAAGRSGSEPGPSLPLSPDLADERVERLAARRGCRERVPVLEVAQVGAGSRELRGLGAATERADATVGREAVPREVPVGEAPAGVPLERVLLGVEGGLLLLGGCSAPARFAVPAGATAKASLCSCTVGLSVRTTLVARKVRRAADRKTTGLPMGAPHAANVHPVTEDLGSTYQRGVSEPRLPDDVDPRRGARRPPAGRAPRARGIDQRRQRRVERASGERRCTRTTRRRASRRARPATSLARVTSEGSRPRPQPLPATRCRTRRQQRAPRQARGGRPRRAVFASTVKAATRGGANVMLPYALPPRRLSGRCRASKAAWLQVVRGGPAWNSNQGATDYEDVARVRLRPV
jgi:hypothetical protein